MKLVQTQQIYPIQKSLTQNKHNKSLTNIFAEIPQYHLSFCAQRQMTTDAELHFSYITTLCDSGTHVVLYGVPQSEGVTKPNR